MDRRGRVRRIVLGVVALALLAAPPSRAEAPQPPQKPQKAPQEKLILAFVLLSEPKLPKGEAIERAFPAYAAKGQTLVYRPEKHEKPDPKRKPEEGDALVLDVDGDRAALMMIPSPVPKGEADEAARYSISGLNGKWKLPPHKAHIIVTIPAARGDAVTRLSALTSLLAAVAEVSPAVGIYCGDAGATHDPKFFRTMAAGGNVFPSRIMLWNGVSIAREGDRYSLLSLGMKQLDLPDLLLIVPPARADDAITFMMDLLTMVVRDGKALPEGDTVGRSATEKLPVHYVTSPVDPKAKVWRVEMK
jgi:hypothetical protein